MTEQVDNSPRAIDTVKLALSIVVLIGGIVGFYMLTQQPPVVRWLLVIGALVVAALIAMRSMQGQQFWQFVQGSRIELRKVIWPSRQETMQTTLVVLVFVLIAGVFFWLLDMLLAWATKLLTGQGS
jgi:preprotein translocase subunit SecE